MTDRATKLQIAVITPHKSGFGSTVDSSSTRYDIMESIAGAFYGIDEPAVNLLAIHTGSGRIIAQTYIVEGQDDDKVEDFIAEVTMYLEEAA